MDSRWYGEPSISSGRGRDLEDANVFSAEWRPKVTDDSRALEWPKKVRCSQSGRALNYLLGPVGSDDVE